MLAEVRTASNKIRHILALSHVILFEFELDRSKNSVTVKIFVVTLRFLSWARSKTASLPQLGSWPAACWSGQSVFYSGRPISIRARPKFSCLSHQASYQFDIVIDYLPQASKHLSFIGVPSSDRQAHIVR